MFSSLTHNPRLSFLLALPKIIRDNVFAIVTVWHITLLSQIAVVQAFHPSSDMNIRAKGLEKLRQCCKRNPDSYLGQSRRLYKM